MNLMEYAVSIGENLRRMRLAKGITQLELSRLSGVTPATISRIEQEVNLNPRTDTTLKLADALKVAIAELVGSSDPERGLSHAEDASPRSARMQRLKIGFDRLSDKDQEFVVDWVERTPPAKRPKREGHNSLG